MRSVSSLQEEEEEVLSTGGEGVTAMLKVPEGKIEIFFE